MNFVSGQMGFAPDCVSFDRAELSAILNYYGRMVALGEWKDYAIDCRADAATFSIFRRTAEHPVYRVEKRPKLARAQGAFAVIGMDGRILRRGRALLPVLRVFDPKLIKLVNSD